MSVPRRLAYALAVFFSDVHYLFAQRDRDSVGENLKAIFPQKSRQEIAGIRLRMFRNFAKYLADFFRFEKLNLRFVQERVNVENFHYIEESLALGRGVVTVTAHLGNWELGGAIVGILGYPLWAVALSHRDGRVNDFFNAQRKSKGVHIIPLGKAVRQCLSVLKDNRILALVGDRDFAERGMILPFFGRPAHFPEGPAAFALRTGAPIVPGFTLRNPDDTFTLRFEKPIDCAPSGNTEKDTRQIITRYKEVMEEFIKKFPDQWYMFKRFWIDPPDKR